MWYNHFNEYLKWEVCMYYLICLCIFIMFNICNYYSICGTLDFVGTLKEITRIVDYLKSKFEMKYLRKQNFCLGLQIEYFSNKILIYYSTYTKKVLKHFHIGTFYPLSSSMIVSSLEVKKDPFHLKEDNEKLLGLEVSYYNVIGTLMNLANYTRPDIAFLVNLLARYSSTPTQIHLNKVNHVLR